MAGVEQDNFNNEELIEEAARYACIYHRNSKDFKDKNGKASYGELRIYRRYMKRLKTLPLGAGRDVAK